MEKGEETLQFMTVRTKTRANIQTFATEPLSPGLFHPRLRVDCHVAGRPQEFEFWR